MPSRILSDVDFGREHFNLSSMVPCYLQTLEEAVICGHVVHAACQ